MDAIECIKTRRSIRSYTDEPVSKENLRKIIDCVRMAPSSRNKQQWKFFVVSDKALLKQLGEKVVNGKFVDGAGAAIVVNGLTENHRLSEDCGCATQTILLSAHALGLGGCWVACSGKDYAEDVRRILDVPVEYTIFSIAVLGHPERAIPAPSKKTIEEVSEWL